ncbi:MAG TPA: hypothetical protein PKM65_20155 [Spirochaetota bacterium]|nr:hypothetical protein [Spirochaetota bacterium]
MALNGDALGQAVLAKIAALSPEQKQNTEAVWKAIGNGIVDYIKANAQVSSTVNVASVSGVQTGTGVSGPGTGTATGTIS